LNLKVIQFEENAYIKEQFNVCSQRIFHCDFTLRKESGRKIIDCWEMNIFWKKLVRAYFDRGLRG